METEAKGFSVARQVAFIEFLSSIHDLNLNLLSDSILKGMLSLIVTIVRMHCQDRGPNTSDDELNDRVNDDASGFGDVKVQN